MNTHFCKVGKIRLNTESVLNLKELERRYLSFMEEAYNYMYSDAGLSDLLYHEASQLRKRILNFKTIETTGLRASL